LENGKDNIRYYRWDMMPTVIQLISLISKTMVGPYPYKMQRLIYRSQNIGVGMAEGSKAHE